MKFFINSGAYPGIVKAIQDRGHHVVGEPDHVDEFVCYRYFADPNITMQKYNDVLKAQIDAHRPDVYICCKGHFFNKYVLPETTEWIRKKVGVTIYWSQDDPFFVPQFSSLYMHRGYDIALTCDMASIATYRQLGIPRAYLWWPAWDDYGRPFMPTEEEMKVDCIFVGSPYAISPLRRKDMIRGLIKNGVNVHIYGDKMWLTENDKGMLSGSPEFKDYYKGSWDNWGSVHTLFAQSRINISNHIVRSPGYLNDRVFMVMGVGGFLLLDNQPKINEYFVDGDEVVYYSTVEDLVKKSKYYLDHQDIRDRIGKNARKKILEKHTYTNRIEELLKILASLGIT